VLSKPLSRASSSASAFCLPRRNVLFANSLAAWIRAKRVFCAHTTSNKRPTTVTCSITQTIRVVCANTGKTKNLIAIPCRMIYTQVKTYIVILIQDLYSAMASEDTKAVHGAQCQHIMRPSVKPLIFFCYTPALANVHTKFGFLLTFLFSRWKARTEPTNRRTDRRTRSTCNVAYLRQLHHNKNLARFA